MSNPPTYNLAIETSTPHGSLTLGLADKVLHTCAIPPARRHTVELLPTLDALLHQHQLTPSDLHEIYLSVGPGSFTGLRIAIATVQMLALVRERTTISHHSSPLRIVAVPTACAIARHIDPHEQLPRLPMPLAPDAPLTLAVIMNLKADSVVVQHFACDPNQRDVTWVTRENHEEPMVCTISQLLDANTAPHILAGVTLPAGLAQTTCHPPMIIITGEFLAPTSLQVWLEGRACARENRLTNPLTLLPLYVREPEAVTLWNQRPSRT